MNRVSQLPPIEGDPQPQVAWQLWYKDTFDRESFPCVELQGCGLVVGLMELWVRYLGEELGGFSRFSLSWESGNATISGPKQAMERLKESVFEGRSVDKGYLRAADLELTRLLAMRHACQGLPSILELAESCRTKPELVRVLSQPHSPQI